MAASAGKLRSVHAMAAQEAMATQAMTAAPPAKSVTASCLGRE